MKKRWSLNCYGPETNYSLNYSLFKPLKKKWDLVMLVKLLTKWELLQVNILDLGKNSKFLFIAMNCIILYLRRMGGNWYLEVTKIIIDYLQKTQYGHTNKTTKRVYTCLKLYLKWTMTQFTKKYLMNFWVYNKENKVEWIQLLIRLYKLFFSLVLLMLIT